MFDQIPEITGKAYSKPNQKSEMELFTKIINAESCQLFSQKATS